MNKLFILILLPIIVFAGGTPLPPTSSKISGDSANVTTFNFQFPNLTGTHTGTTVSIPTFPLPTPAPSGNYLQANGTAWVGTAAAPSNVTSSGASNYHVEYVSFGGSGSFTAKTNCVSSPCTIYLASNAGITVTKSGSGLYDVNMPVGVFSGPFVCGGTALQVGVLNVFWSLNGSNSGTSTVYKGGTFTGAGSAVDATADLICMGPQ